MVSASLCSGRLRRLERQLVGHLAVHVDLEAVAPSLRRYRPVGEQPALPITVAAGTDLVLGLDDLAHTIREDGDKSECFQRWAVDGQRHQDGNHDGRANADLAVTDAMKSPRRGLVPVIQLL